MSIVAILAIIILQMGMTCSSPVESSVLRGSIDPIVRELQIIDPVNTNHFNCTFAPIDCSNNGVCNQDGSACICNKGYVTRGTGNQCDYAQKKQVIAFLLAFFLAGTGASYFYMGIQTLALANLLAVGWGSVIFLSMFLCCSVCFGGKKTRLTTFFTALIALNAIAMVVWWLVLTIQTGVNSLNDSNDVPLLGW
jgi:hypothetical protein